ncbi:MAG: serine hydrolase domain-containing protein [Acidobacteriota bacterium]
MNQSFAKIHAFLKSEIARGTFPGAQFVIGERGKIIEDAALGFAVLTPERIAATTETIYDLASLTKPLVTTLLTVKFSERGLLDLHAEASRYLEELLGTDKQAMTLQELLTHTSGLEKWRPLYLEARSRNDVVAAISHAARDTKSAPVAVYSDLNFILLGFVLERVAGARLDVIAHREIFEPLNLRRTRFHPPPELKSQIAATELGQMHERATVKAEKFLCRLPDKTLIEKSPQPLKRKQLIWGEAHDGNAYFMDGVAGHAGLFSTAREVWVIANQFLPGSQLLKSESLKYFSTNYSPGGSNDRSLGWMLASTSDCSAGKRLPPEAFGHNGFTGTSVWLDGERKRVFVLLTNRVHPQVRDLGMKQARQQFNSLAVEALERMAQ